MGKEMDYKRPALLVTTVAAFLVPFMGSSVNIALPSIGKEFAMDAVLLSWVTVSYLLSGAVFLVPFGRMADIRGRKKTFLLGFVIYTITSLLCGIATSPLLLIFFRVLNGVGTSMTASTGMAMLMSIYPPEERGKVLGINVAAVYTGLSCGPFLGGLLTQHLGWRSIFLANVPLGLLIIVFTLWKLKGDWLEAKGEKFDLTGAILFSVALVAIMYGFSTLPGLQGVCFVLLGGFGFLAFLKWEMRTPSPIFELSLFSRNRVFALSNLAALINYSATFAVSFFISLYLQFIQGHNPQEAGMVLVAQPLMQAIFSPLAGRLSDRIEPRVIASTGMALTAIGLFFLVFVDQETPIAFIIGSLLLLGLGFALFSSPNTNAVMSSVEKKSYGVASGTLGTMRATGMMFSMGMAMMIFAILIGRAQITPPFYPAFMKSMKVAFAISTGLCVAGIFASLSRGKVRSVQP